MSVQLPFAAPYQGKIELDYMPCLNYALVYNGVKACNRCEVTNDTAAPLRELELSLTGAMFAPCRAGIALVEPGATVRVDDFEIRPDAEQLLKLTESVLTTFRVTLTCGGDTLFEHDYEINIMAYEHWLGSAIMPQMLAAFVTPNSPAVPAILADAARFMKEWTGASAMDEYQSQDHNRARQQVAAIYEALRSRALVYATPPAGFEKSGQRVRLADRVLSEKLGTCLDLSLLYASCLEAAGLYPLVILSKGHAFVGAWLTPMTAPRMVIDDASFVLKSCADGISDMVVVESTMLTSDGDVTFERAVEKAMATLGEAESFVAAIDVQRCRLEGVRPLPQRNADGSLAVVEGIDHSNATTGVAEQHRYGDLLPQGTTTLTKQQLWERKLLDISLRNNLINMRIGRRVIPLVSFNLDTLEDRIYDGASFQVMPAPTEGLKPDEWGIYNSASAPQLSQLVVAEMDNNRLCSYLSDSELQQALKYVYRTSRTLQEENGANSLFLSLGMLKWYETDKSQRPRYAPILLMPIDIVRHGGNRGYAVRSRDEEITLNITLCELLKQQFDLSLDGLNPLPTDDHGVDVRRIFTAVRQCIRNMSRWDVIEEAMIGLFSFNKFVMWNDIHTNAALIHQNPVVSSLMDGRVKWTDTSAPTDARQLDTQAKPADYATPLDVDSSQLEAVIDSGQGKSFILYGPPGTGKSQTISNMIANALYHGKRVLFVAEKMAALEVVQKRLKKLGLDPFCLEIHSNKATKSHFLDQLSQAIDVARIKEPAEFEQLSQELYEQRQELIQYIDALHRKRESGLSLYECITNYLTENVGEVKLDEEVVAALTGADITALAEQLRQLDTVFQVSGQPCTHPLRGLYPEGFDPATIAAINPRPLAEALAHLKEARQLLADVMEVETPDTGQGLGLMKQIVDALREIPSLNADVIAIASSEQRTAVGQAVEAGRNRDAIYAEVTGTLALADGIFAENPDALASQWQQATAKWFIPRYFATNAVKKQLSRYGKVSKAQIPALIEKLQAHKRDDAVVAASAQLIARLSSDGVPQWDKIASTVANGLLLYNAVVAAARAADRQPAEALSAFMNKVGTNFEQFRTLYTPHLSQIVEWIDDYNKALADLKAHAEVDLPDVGLTGFGAALAAGWSDALGQSAKDWYQWAYRRKALIERGLRPVVQAIEEAGHTGAEAASLFVKSVSHSKALAIVAADPRLQLFNGLIFEQQIAKYRQLTSQFQELTKKELYCRLAARIPSLTMEASASSEVGIVKRNIANHGRGTSIRRIIDQIPTLLPKLCPCMLMSPISVAQYIDLNAEKFDIVIFDEASQMPTSEAVGAIARGKNLVVVGDPRQMPPTSFFTTTSTNDDEADIDDMESILDDCISLSMPSYYLSWHYRSKHESLIAFSNENYYESRLYTFPSVDDRVSKVTLVPVTGTYDKGRSRSNRAEAQAIVDEVVRRLSDPELRKRSIGVVSFSQVQQNLIEDILTETLAGKAELEEAAYGGEEPIFIKNLENVQGDERDVILFSVGYGPDKDGNVSMNFGPLNNQGGERRLNVAVSRARYEMVIYSTLMPEQIDLNRSKAKGVEGLKRFLEFARSGRLATSSAVMAANEQHSEFVTLVAEALRAKGYQVDTLVGRSKFKVDLAVLHPSKENEYMLGILCDGHNYYDTKTTRDREIVQPNVLHMLNWNVMRVWSIDWFDNSEAVVKRITDRIAAILAGTDTPTPAERPVEVKKFNPAEEATVEITNARRKPYTLSRLQASSFKNTQDVVLNSSARVRDQLKSLIHAEQPITNTLLYKRIAELWGLARMTPKVQMLIDQHLMSYYVDPLSDGTTLVYWESKAAAEGYNTYREAAGRSVVDIPVMEVMNVVDYIVGEQVSLTRDDMQRLAAVELGFARRTPNTDEAIARAIDLLAKQGKVAVEGDRVVRR